MREAESALPGSRRRLRGRQGEANLRSAVWMWIIVGRSATKPVPIMYIRWHRGERRGMIVQVSSSRSSLAPSSIALVDGALLSSVTRVAHRPGYPVAPVESRDSMNRATSIALYLRGLRAEPSPSFMGMRWPAFE